MWGWLVGRYQTTSEERKLLLFTLGIEVENLLLFAKDCSGKPDLKGNALKMTFLIRFSNTVGIGHGNNLTHKFKSIQATLCYGFAGGSFVKTLITIRI
jgi:hypothetical protein